MTLRNTDAEWIIVSVKLAVAQKKNTKQKNGYEAVRSCLISRQAATAKIAK